MSSTDPSGVAMDQILVVPTKESRLLDYGRPVVRVQGHISSYVARPGEATVSAHHRVASVVRWQAQNTTERNRWTQLGDSPCAFDCSPFVSSWRRCRFCMRTIPNRPDRLWWTPR